MRKMIEEHKPLCVCVAIMIAAAESQRQKEKGRTPNGSERLTETTQLPSEIRCFHTTKPPRTVAQTVKAGAAGFSWSSIITICSLELGQNSVFLFVHLCYYSRLVHVLYTAYRSWIQPILLLLPPLLWDSVVFDAVFSLVLVPQVSRYSLRSITSFT